MQVYSIDNKPISAVHVIPSSLASVFMELRTLQAPVPQDRSMIPVRPMIEAFSLNEASVIGRPILFLV